MSRSRDGRHPGAAGRTAAKGDTKPQFAETAEQFEGRLRRDRRVGISGLVAFLVVLLLNFVMEFAPEFRLLPGGHSELYFLAAALGASWSAWITFDLGNSRRIRRRR